MLKKINNNYQQRHSINERISNNNGLVCMQPVSPTCWRRGTWCVERGGHATDWRLTDTTAKNEKERVARAVLECRHRGVVVNLTPLLINFERRAVWQCLGRTYTPAFSILQKAPSCFLLMMFVSHRRVRPINQSRRRSRCYARMENQFRCRRKRSLVEAIRKRDKVRAGNRPRGGENGKKLISERTITSSGRSQV